MNTRFALAALVIATPFVAAPGPATTPGEDPGSPGAALFARHCAACHTLGAGPSVGPDLAGVTRRRSGDWLVRWIDDPAAQVHSDSTARALVQEWGGWVMPSLDLTGPELIDIVDFLTEADAGKLAPEVLTEATTPAAGSRCGMGMGPRAGACPMKAAGGEGAKGACMMADSACPMCGGGARRGGPGGGHGHGHGPGHGHGGS